MSALEEHEDVLVSLGQVESRVDISREPNNDLAFDVPNISTSRSGRKIEILEILDETMILVSWQDPTGGRYGHQTWTRSFARRSGICAFSSARFSPGQSIFRPKAVAGRRPVNWDERILESALRILCSLD